MKVQLCRVSHAAMTVAAATAMIVGLPASAQERGGASQAVPDAGTDTGLQEIVVTAERRATSAQRSALAISVLSAEELQRKGITNVDEMLSSVPGLNVSHAQNSVNISIRGLISGGSTQYADPVIAFTTGGVALARGYSTGGAFFDLARVEVLKGPQGTLYGRNATVGAINLIPNPPEQELGGSVFAQIGNYNQVNLIGVVNLPLSSTLATRVAVSTNHRDGYLSNGYNDENNQSMRASALYKPSDDLSVLLRAELYRDNSRGYITSYTYLVPNQRFLFGDPWFAFAPAGCGNVTACPTFGDSSPSLFDPAFAGVSVNGADGYSHLNQGIYSAEVNLNLSDDIMLTLLPGYVHTRMETLTYTGGLRQLIRNRTNQISAEARLSSRGEGPFKWVAGLFYFREHADAQGNILEPAGVQVNDTPDLIDRSHAVFAQGTYAIFDRLRLTAGARYTKEHKSQAGTITLTGAFTARTCPSPAAPVRSPVTAFGNYYPLGYCLAPNSGSLDEDKVNYKVGVEFDVAPRSLLFGTIATGFKAGGLTPGLPPNTFKPEELTAYTLGMKNRFFDNRVQLNVEAFYWKYKDQQISLVQMLNPAGQGSKPVNVPGHVKGVEVESSVLVTQNDLISANVLYAKGKYDVYPTAVSSSGVIGGLTDYPRVNLPRWNGTVQAQHSFPFASGASVVLSGAMKFVSRANLRPVLPVNSVPGDFQPSYQKYDAQLTFNDASDKWSVTGFVENISNVATISTGVQGTVTQGGFYRPPTNPAAARYATVQAPRTFGVRGNIKF